MLHHTLALVTVLSVALAGCGNKEESKPAAKTGTPPAGVTADKSAFVLPPECETFKKSWDKLAACESLAGSRDKMKQGYEKMLKAMIDLNDAKAAADGCKDGQTALDATLQQAGC